MPPHVRPRNTLSALYGFWELAPYLSSYFPYTDGSFVHLVAQAASHWRSVNAFVGRSRVVLFVGWREPGAA